MDHTQIVLEDIHNATEGPPVEIRSLDNIYTIVEIITAVAAVIGMSYIRLFHNGTSHLVITHSS